MSNYFDWQEIHGFSSPREFEEFCTWIRNQIRIGIARNIDEQNVLSDIPYGAQVTYYRNEVTGSVWRLIAPDPPFRGTWAPVD